MLLFLPIAGICRGRNQPRSDGRLLGKARNQLVCKKWHFYGSALDNVIPDSTNPDVYAKLLIADRWSDVGRPLRVHVVPVVGLPSFGLQVEDGNVHQNLLEAPPPRSRHKIHSLIPN